MKVSGAIIPSTVCSCMTRLSRWILRKLFQPVVDLKKTMALVLLLYYISLYLHNVKRIRDYKNGRMSITIYQKIRNKVN